MNNSSTKSIITIVIGLVSVPLIWKLMMWLINDVQISPVWFTLIIMYAALVYPQYSALYAMKLVEYNQEGYDLSDASPDKSNWIIFWNDISLAKYFGFDSMFRKIISWSMLISIPLFIFSVLYTNFLVVFIDLGYNATVFIMYMLIASFIVYLVTKTIITITLLNMFKGPTQAIFGIIYPLGLFLIVSAVKMYLSNLEEVQYDERLGEGH